MSQRHRLLEKATSGVPSFDSGKLSYQSGQVGIAVLEVTDPDPVLKVAEEPSCVEIGSWGVGPGMEACSQSLPSAFQKL